MKKTIFLAALSFASIGPASVAHGNVTAATVTSEGQSHTLNIVHQVPSPLLAQPTSWAFIYLPVGYSPSASSETGVVLLYDATCFYRWSAGGIENLHPRVPYPADGYVYSFGSGSARMNADGDIALGWHFYDRRSGHYRDVDLVKIWSRTAVAPRELSVPVFTYTVAGYRDVSTFYAAIASLNAIDDSESVWVVEGLETVPFDVGTYRLRKGLVRVDTAGTIFQTPLQQPDVLNGSSFVVNGINGAGIAIGQVAKGVTKSYFVGENKVDFEPVYANKNGWMLGLNSNKERIVIAPDGTRAPTPSDGTVTWIDNQNRLNGYYNPPGQASRNAVWVEKKDADGQPFIPADYQRIDYVPLQAPESWTTNHKVAPGTLSRQLGIMTRTDGSESRPFLAIPAELAVDGDRDGRIKLASEGSSDAVTADNPYRFWINDDDDRSDKDHIESSKKDWEDSEINSIRDLEDFARLNIFIGGLQDAVLNGSLRIGLKWTNIQSGAPSVKVWRNLSPSGGKEYLFDEAIASQHLTLGAPGHVQGSTTYSIPLVFWQQGGFSATQPNGYLLFEGCTEGRGQLVMTINKPDGTEIGEGPGVWLDIKNIKSMYERAVATTGGSRSENGVDYTIPLPYSYVSPDPSNIAQPTMGWEPNPQGHPYQPDPAETKTYFIYVHGWRWSPAKANNRTETVLKRLWHLGYKGRLSALRWPTFYGGPDDGDDWVAGLSTYNHSEYRAWKSGESLKQYVNQLPSNYTRSVVAHSMGNIVTGSALRKGMEVVNYVLLNAAVPAMCYDESTSLNQWNYITPNDDPDSGTKDMAYMGKFKALNSNVINFFLTRDSATTFAWETNNDRFKPQRQIITSCVRGYYYARANPENMKFYVDFCVSPLRYLIDEDEAMAFACQSLTKTIGAEGRASGSIDSTVDMDAYSFGDEHGAEWDRNIMQTKAFYIQLMRSLQIPVQP